MMLLTWNRDMAFPNEKWIKTDIMNPSASEKYSDPYFQPFPTVSRTFCAR